MKKIWNAILACLTLATTNSIAKSTDSQCPRGISGELRISLAIEKDSFKFGENISATVTVKNTGSSIVFLPALMEAEDYWLRFEIIDSLGRKLLFSGPEINKMHANSKVALLPNYFFGVEVENLSNFYKFPSAGTYSIQAIYGRSPNGRCELGEHRSPVMRLVLN